MFSGLFISEPVYTQTAPPPPNHFFRSDTLVTTNAGLVVSWRDILNQAIIFEQPTANRRPSWATGINDWQILDFNAGNNFLTLNSSITPQTICILLKVDAFPNYARIIDAQGANYSGIHINSNGFEGRFNGVASGNISFGDNVPTYTMITVVSSGSNVSTPPIGRAFGITAVFPGIRNWLAGNYQLGRNGLSMNGEVLELSVFNSDLSEGQVIVYENERYNYYVAPLELSENDTISTENFCSVTLDAGERFSSFLWQDQSTNQTFIANSPGWYSVTVTDLFGRTFEDSVYIAYPGNYLGSLQLCGNETVIYDTGLNPADYTFEWSTGVTSPTIAISEAGSYFVTVTDNQGCEYTSDPIIVDIDNFESLVQIIEPEVFCTGNAISVGGFSESVESILWSTGSVESFIQPQASGLYWVEVENLNGCIGQDTTEIFIAGEAPVVGITHSILCQGEPVQFTSEVNVDPDLVSSYQWEIDGTVINTPDISFVFEDYGDHLVSLTVEMLSGCLGIRDSVVNIFATPILNFSLPDVICDQSEVDFDAIVDIPDNSAINEVIWTFPDGSIQNSLSASYFFSTSGSETVGLEIVTANGCSGNIEKQVIISNDDITTGFYSPSCAGLAHFFRSDTLVTTNAGKVVSWRDILNQAVLFEQGTALKRPSLITGINDWEILDFNASNNFLTLNTAIAPQTISILLKVDAFPNYARIIDAQGPNYSGIHINSNGFEGRFNGVLSGNISFGEDTSAYTMLTVVSSGNNEPISSAFGRAFGVTTIFPGIRDWLAGNYQLGRDGLSMNGEVLELAIFDRELSEEEVQFYENERYNYYIAPLDFAENDTIKTDNFCEFTLDAGERFSSFLWQDQSTNQTIIANSPGWYSTTVTDLFGRTFEDSVYIAYPGNYLESFILCLNDTFLYDTQLDPAFYTFAWSTSETTPAIEIFAEAEYSLTVTDTLGCSYTTAPIVVTVDDFPETAALIDYPVFCLGNELLLSSGFAEAESYLWSTGSSDPIITPQNSGTYWVEVTNVNGCVGRDTVEIDIAGVAPVAEFATGLRCAGEPVVFTDGTVPEDAVVVDWLWNFGPGQTPGTEPEVAVIFPETGSYPVSLTVTLDNGCTGTVRDTIDVYAIPEVGFSAPLVCSDNEVFFEDLSTVAGGSISQQTWTFGNGTTDTGVVGSSIFTEVGPNTVVLEVTSAQGCTATLSRNIEVLGSPVADFNADAVCTGMPVGFFEAVDVSVSGPVFYNWQFGDGFFSNFPNTSHVYAAPGTYSATLTATGNNGGLPGCVDAVTKTIRVYTAPLPEITLTGACVGEAVVMTDNTQPQILDGVPDPIAARTWELHQNGNLIASIPNGNATEEVVVALSGNVTIDFDLITEAGCTVSATGTVPVTEIPEAGFELILPETAPPFGVVPTNTSINAESYTWLINGVEVATGPAPELVFPDTGTYTVTLIATSGVGCDDAATASFTVLNPTYDLAIADIVYTETAGQLHLSAILTNFGNVPVRTFDMDVTVGQDIRIMQEIEHVIPPTSTVSYPLDASFFVIPGRTLPYTCIVVSNPNGVGDNEERLDNNGYCIGLDRERAVFIDPYPNPVSGELHLGVVVPEGGRLNIAFVDSQGKVVRDFVWEIEKGYGVKVVDLSGLRTGLYLLRYLFNGEEEVKRVVVE